MQQFEVVYPAVFLQYERYNANFLRQISALLPYVNYKVTDTRSRFRRTIRHKVRRVARCAYIQYRNNYVDREIHTIL